VSAQKKIEIEELTPISNIETNSKNSNTEEKNTLKKEIDQLANIILTSSSESLDNIDLSTSDESLGVVVSFINQNRTEVQSSLKVLTEKIINTVKSMTSSSRTLDQILALC
jgi:hypothetical protein